MAIKLLELPKSLGKYTDGGDMMLNLGRYGPYLSLSVSESVNRTQEVVCAIPSNMSMWEVEPATAAALLTKKLERGASVRGRGRRAVTTGSTSRKASIPSRRVTASAGK